MRRHYFSAAECCYKDQCHAFEASGVSCAALNPRPFQHREEQVLRTGMGGHVSPSWELRGNLGFAGQVAGQFPNGSRESELLVCAPFIAVLSR